MSDGKEVKRWFAWECEEIFDSNKQFIAASDHDRIVAELRAEVERLKELTEPVAMITASPFMVENITIDQRYKFEKTIATQAKVIEIATRTMATVLELEHCGQTSCPRPTRAMCSNESHKVLRSALREIAAIEKEGAKDDNSLRQASAI